MVDGFDRNRAKVDVQGLGERGAYATGIKHIPIAYTQRGERGHRNTYPLTVFLDIKNALYQETKHEDHAHI